jgi:hypothetical protein
MINSYEGVNEASQRLQEQNYEDESSINSLQLWEMLKQREGSNAFTNK